ncbi:MAG: hypothetical protein HY914_20600 [Desulfomonile tiedjei]|nr:hypothetical protein [Desulfomonile tiedjei]
MIHFDPSPEPTDFDEKVRRPGRQWLDADPTTRPAKPPNCWTSCKDQLAEAFNFLCGYSAMHIGLEGAVEHYLSKSDHPEFAYEWTNYRYASDRINSRKAAHGAKILDPFEVQNGWFEVQLGSWQLMMTDQIPEAHRERAQFTVDKLRLGADDYVIRQRRQWYRCFYIGEESLTGLMRRAPLVCSAVKKVIDQVEPTEAEAGVFQDFVQGLVTLPKLYPDAPQIATRLTEELPPCPRGYSA